METDSSLQTIAFLGNYPPRKCGIATFTSDLLSAVVARQPLSQCFAVPVTDIDRYYAYPEIVRHEIEEQDVASYREAADFLNSSDVDVISLQHEFGIFGGPAGSHLLTLLRLLKAPVVTTLHTVLLNPNVDQRQVMQELIAQSARLVVMTERGRTLLQEVYQAPPAKIDLIPHGIPDVVFRAPDSYKDQLGLAGRKVLLTFGLLSPNKGIEHVINALSGIVAEFPEVIYVLLGATHPHELRTHGETYREGLENLVRKNRLEDNVLFHNRFVELGELTDFIGAADLYITPYLGEAQVTSGTLAYAFGAGKAVISTPYWHAVELLKNQRGVLVPFADPGAIAHEASGLLRDEERRKAMGAKAYQLGREMVWSNTAALYLGSFDKALREVDEPLQGSGAVREPLKRPFESPEFNLEHLCSMTDSMGLFQHAKLTKPNFSEGYCTDDNARALILTVLLGQLESPVRARVLGATYAAFLHHAFARKTMRFHNFLSTDLRWLDHEGSEDCHGRAIWALGTLVGRAPNWSSHTLAGQIFLLALPVVKKLTSPRAWAFSLLGIHEYLNYVKGDHEAKDIRADLIRRLITIFDHVAQPGWTWFEEGLAYDNAKLAHALIVSGRAMGREDVYERGMEALRWLVGVQTSEHGQFRPIGSNGFYQRSGPRAYFDQQPIEAHATVSACLEAYRLTGDLWWYDKAQCAFDWFLGWNDLGIELYAKQSGGCRDGLHPDRVNENQGAESMLAFLLSLAEMRLVQNMGSSVQSAGAATSIIQ